MEFGRGPEGRLDNGDVLNVLRREEGPTFNCKIGPKSKWRVWDCSNPNMRGSPSDVDSKAGWRMPGSRGPNESTWKSPKSLGSKSGKDGGECLSLAPASMEAVVLRVGITAGADVETTPS
jgi:hypothetical protein